MIHHCVPLGEPGRTYSVKTSSRFAPLLLALVCLTSLPFITACKSQKPRGRDRVQHRNPGADHTKISDFLSDVRSKYKMNSRTQTYMRGGEEYMKSGRTNRTWWFFKTKKPVSSKEGAGYYYRFSLTRTTFKSLTHAERAFIAIKQGFEGEREGEGKGNVSYTLLAGPHLYELSTDCLMNRRLGHYFTALTKTLLAGKRPDPGSLLIHHCGGGHTQF